MVDKSIKISPSVLARLENMTNGDAISVIVLIERNAEEGERRRRGGNREQLMADLQEQTRGTLQEIDRVLATRGGQREGVIGSLGAVAVIASAPAIVEIANIASVRSIIEDQPLRELT